MGHAGNKSLKIIYIAYLVIMVPNFAHELRELGLVGPKVKLAANKGTLKLKTKIKWDKH